MWKYWEGNKFWSVGRMSVLEDTEILTHSFAVWILQFIQEMGSIYHLAWTLEQLTEIVMLDLGLPFFQLTAGGGLSLCKVHYPPFLLYVFQFSIKAFYTFLGCCGLFIDHEFNHYLFIFHTPVRNFWLLNPLAEWWM